MNDPKRLVEEGPTDLERSLLTAVAAEEPSAEHRMRVRQAMGLGPAAAPTAATAASAGAASSEPLGNTLRGGMGKMAVLGVVAAGAIAALLLVGRNRPASPPALQPASTPAPEVVIAPATPEAPVAAPAETTTPTAEAPDPAATPQVAHHSTAPSPSANSDIREQIRLIDEARSAVSAHDAASALRALDQYRSKFPSGALDQEATVLRIEALDQRGDHALAASMARAFLARNPASAHANRLQRIAGQ